MISEISLLISLFIDAISPVIFVFVPLFASEKTILSLSFSNFSFASSLISPLYKDATLV